MSEARCSGAVKPIGSKRTLDRVLRAYSDATVRCPTCLERLELNVYVGEHAVERHGRHPDRVCIYCSDDVRWPAARKPDFKHVVPCLRRLIGATSFESPVEEEPPLVRVLRPCDECKNFRSEPRDLYGREKKMDCPSLYESWYERPEAYGESAVTFTEESGLGRDVYAIVQRFSRGDLKWYHLMVVDQNFVNAFDEMKNRMFLLPFWCLCDGLTESRKTHRHMILAIEPETDFLDVWRKEVKCPMEDGGQSKTYKRIGSAFHLIRTIQYVSQRKSSCDGKRIKEVVGNRFRLSHFYMNKPLHEHAVAFMSMLFEGGLEKLIVEQNRNKDVVGWLKHVQLKWTEDHNLQYVVPIGVTGFKFLNCVLPLSPELEPSEEETNLGLHWIGKKKLYLKTNTSLKNVSREEWYARQTTKGNTLTSISWEPYVLCPGQQNVMKQIKIALERQEETDKRVREDMCRIYDARMADLKEENAGLRSRMTALETDLRQKMTVEFADMRQKMIALEAENAHLRQTMRTVTVLEAENANLRQNMRTVLMLEAENVDQKHKIQTLKRMLLDLSGSHNQSIANFVNQL